MRKGNCECRTWRHRWIEAKPFHAKERNLFVFSVCTKARNQSQHCYSENSEKKWNPKFTYLNRIKKSTSESFFSSMSRTISPDLKLNLSFYVDLASDFEIIPLAKNKRIFFRFEIDSKQYLSSCSSKCLVHPRSYIHIHFRIWIKLKFMYQQTRKVMFHPISITRQADWNKPRRSKDFWRPPNRMKNWIVFCVFSQMSNFSWRNSKL